MRRFVLDRTTDTSGVSGTGIVAGGVQFAANGKVVMCWLMKPYGMNVYDSMEDVIEVHGHDGATRLVWIDEESYGLGE